MFAMGERTQHWDGPGRPLQVVGVGDIETHHARVLDRRKWLPHPSAASSASLVAKMGHFASFVLKTLQSKNAANLTQGQGVCKKHMQHCSCSTTPFISSCYRHTDTGHSDHKRHAAAHRVLDLTSHN